MLSHLFHLKGLFNKCWGKQVQQFNGVTVCYNSTKEQLENRFVCSSTSGYIWSADPDTYAVQILLLVCLQHTRYHWEWQIIVGTQMLREKKILIKIYISIQMANLLSNLEAINNLALENHLLLGMDYYVGLSLR